MRYLVVLKESKINPTTNPLTAGLPAETASDVYATLAATLPSDGLPTQRQCDKNQT